MGANETVVPASELQEAFKESDVRWCSDGLELSCDNGEKVRVAFALDVSRASGVFWSNTPVLMGFSALFVVTYVGAYLMIVRFKIPEWLKR